MTLSRRFARILAGALAASALLTGAPAIALAQAAAPAEQDEPRGLNPAGLAAIETRLAELAAAQARAGYVMALQRDGESAHVAAAGWADEAAREPMSAQTPVRIASMTKPVTAAAIMALVEDGAVALDDPLSDYVPAFAEVRVATSTSADETGEIPTEPLERAITIEDLLTHTAGLGYVFDRESDLGQRWVEVDAYSGEGDLEARISRLANAPLYSQPGARWFYSFANDVLGQVIAEASGQSVEAFMQARLFQPLAMTDTTFFPEGDLEDRMSALYTHEEGGVLVRVDEGAETLIDAPVEAGGAGLISTADDYLRFAQMLANGGVLDGVRVLSEASVAAMTAIQVPLEKMPDSMAGIGMGFGYSLGVIAPVAGAAGYPGDFGWAGYFDTEFLVSPATGLVAVIMAQELPSAHTPEGGARDVFRPLAYGAVAPLAAEVDAAE